MRHTLTPNYLNRLSRMKNWTLFGAYVLAGTAAAFFLQYFGVRAAPLSVGALIIAGVFHWRINAAHADALRSCMYVEVEIIDDQIVLRREAGEHRLFLDQLRAVRHSQAFAPIELVFDSGVVRLDGLNHSEKLAARLTQYIQR